MADVDIDRFDYHDQRGLHPDDTGENISLPPVTPGGVGSTWEPDHKQQMSFGGRTSLREKFSENNSKVCIESCLKALFKTQSNSITIILKLEREGFAMRTRTGA